MFLDHSGKGLVVHFHSIERVEVLVLHSDLVDIIVETIIFMSYCWLM